MSSGISHCHDVYHVGTSWGRGIVLIILDGNVVFINIIEIMRCFVDNDVSFLESFLQQDSKGFYSQSTEGHACIVNGSPSRSRQTGCGVIILKQDSNDVCRTSMGGSDMQCCGTFRVGNLRSLCESTYDFVGWVKTTRHVQWSVAAEVFLDGNFVWVTSCPVYHCIP
jgi:hypothetical protein